MDLHKVARSAMFVSTALAAIGCVLYVQSKFDGADRTAALQIVQDYRPPGGRSVPEALDRLYPGVAPSWSTYTESACFQHVRVRAAVAPSPAAAATAYEFMVDINGPSIHPGNEHGKTLLETLATAGAPAASFAPSAPAPSASTPSAPAPSASTPSSAAPAPAPPEVR